MVFGPLSLRIAASVADGDDLVALDRDRLGDGELRVDREDLGVVDDQVGGDGGVAGPGDVGVEPGQGGKNEKSVMTTSRGRFMACPPARYSTRQGLGSRTKSWPIPAVERWEGVAWYSLTIVRRQP